MAIAERRMSKEPDGVAAAMRPVRTDRHATPARRGFSLVELLVVIGIIAVLISLAVIGFKVVGTASREKVTVNQLENCKSLLNEFELTSSLANLLATPPVAAGHWAAPPTVTPPATQLPTDVTGCSTQAARQGSDDLLLQDTARVINKLRTVIKNRESIEKMSADKVKVQPFSTPGALPTGTAVVLLDGSGYPIYFVPGGGLTGVNLAYKGSGDRTASTSYDSSGQTIRAADRRPFWASPGPDGDLTTGDDNLYSFGK